MNQRAIIPITQLINPIRAPYQNQQHAHRQKPRKHLKPSTQLPLPFRPLHKSPAILEHQADENAESEDLEGETGDGDVDGSLAAAGGLRGEGAANGLEDEGEDVAGDEEPVVEFGGETGVLRAEVDDANSCENWTLTGMKGKREEQSKTYIFDNVK